MARDANCNLPVMLGSVRLHGVESFDSDSIVNRAPNQWRWLSLPGSRLVLNPAGAGDFAPQPERPDLPLRVGYYAGPRPHRLLNLVSNGIGPGEGGSVKALEAETDTDEAVAACDTQAHAWCPYKLAFEAGYAADATLRGYDFLADESTIVRVLEPQVAAGSSVGRPVLRLGGTITGTPRQPPRQDCLLLCGHDDFYYAIALGTALDDAHVPIPLAQRAEVRGQRWRIQVPLTADGPRVVAVSVGFATRGEGAEQAVHRATGIFSGPGLARRLAEQKGRWDAYLRHVPAPLEFGLDSVDPRGVTSERHRQFYYGAWAFVISNVLPPMPENGYPYPQTPCGKPSLWNFGASKAPASAAWESFFGQQMLAYVMPDTAWAAFEGIMAQVDNTGWLDGECLPSRKAQTAWILYNLTGDTDRLRRVYPAIKRYLLWRERNPRWIYLEHDHPDEKDASFVDQLLVDIDFAMRIARATGEQGDIAMWQQRRAAILANYREWFFFTDGRLPVEYFFTDSKRHDPGNLNWVVTGLHIPGLPADLASDLKRLYAQLRDPKRDLLGFQLPKYGTESFTAYGLIEQGMFSEAREFINVLLRDQIRAGEFAENYVGRHGPGGSPHAAGVKPSLFGAAQMIDFTCMNNGVRLDQGMPAAFQWPRSGATPPAEITRRDR
jgi:hypothetical protein